MLRDSIPPPEHDHSEPRHAGPSGQEHTRLKRGHAIAFVSGSRGEDGLVNVITVDERAARLIKRAADVTLTLEIITTATAMPSARQRTFREDGGRIGRDKSNDWVLPHNKVSSRHAVVTYRNGVFYIEDRSRNGVFLNSTTNRLTPGRPQALQAGDCLFIEPYRDPGLWYAEDADARALQIQAADDPFRAGGYPGARSPRSASPTSDPLSADDESPTRLTRSSSWPEANVKASRDRPRAQGSDGR